MLTLSVTVSISIITIKHFQAEVRTGGFRSLQVFKVWSAETSQLQHFLVFKFCLGLMVSVVGTDGHGHQGSVVDLAGPLHLQTIFFTISV